MPQTLLDKIWDQHVIAQLGSGLDLLHIDRTLVHDLGGARVFGALQDQGHRVRNPELTFATVDHCCSSLPGRDEQSTESGSRLIPILRDRCVEHFLPKSLSPLREKDDDLVVFTSLAFMH